MSGDEWVGRTQPCPSVAWFDVIRVIGAIEVTFLGVPRPELLDCARPTYNFHNLH